MADDRLHEGLHAWTSSPGEPFGWERLTSAALAHPDEAVKGAGFRIRSRRARTIDFWRLAEHDPRSTWPSIARLCDPAVADATTIGDAVAAGSLEQGDITVTMPAARVTRRAKSVSMGIEHDEQRTTLVPALCTWDCSAALAWPDSTPERSERSITVLATLYSFAGYWHWVLEGLLPLVRMDENDVLAGLDEVIVCVDGPVPPYIRESLHAVGIDDRRLTITSEPFDLAVATLVLPARAPGFGGMLDADEPDDIREVMLRNARYSNAPAMRTARRRLGVDRDGRTERAGRRLLISRRDATTRRVTNEDELAAALAPLGFEIVVLSELPFPEKAAVFASADVVAGPHGAGLTNVIWMAPGSWMVELRHDHDFRTHFEHLADTVDVHHATVPCPSDPESPEDMQVDVDAVVDRVRAAIDGVTER